MDVRKEDLDQLVIAQRMAEKHTKDREAIQHHIRMTEGYYTGRYSQEKRMTIQEALKSGLRLKRAHHNHWLKPTALYGFTVDDILAEDWEIEDDSYELRTFRLSKDNFYKLCKWYDADGSYLAWKKLCKFFELQESNNQDCFASGLVKETELEPT